MPRSQMGAPSDALLERTAKAHRVWALGLPNAAPVRRQSALNAAPLQLLGGAHAGAVRTWRVAIAWSRWRLASSAVSKRGLCLTGVLVIWP